jgi:ABC-2 type transport system permease protein
MQRNTRTFGQSLRAAGRVVAAEALKQHRILFGNRLVYFSLLIWPALQLATAYYTLMPLLGASGVAERWTIAGDARRVLLFVATGMLGYAFFWSLVQSAWQFSFERFAGTLELLFLSPANRLVLMLANCTMALVQSVWLFVLFSLALFGLVGGLQLANPGMVLVAFVAMLIPAVAWGTCLNSLFIFSRDSSFLYTILEEPMSFFAGVRVPLLALPVWAQSIGLLFPLTTSLAVLRGALLEAATVGDLWPQLLLLLAFSASLFGAAALILQVGERRARRNGSLALF